MCFTTRKRSIFAEGSSFYRLAKASRKVRATQGIALPNGKGTERFTDSVTEKYRPDGFGVRVKK